MIRLAILGLFVCAICVYAWRDWRVSALGLLVMTILTQRDDMPTSMLGIQGLNPWNLALAVITLAWAAKRVRKRSSWGAPLWTWLTLLAYVGVVVVAFVHAVMDFGSFPDEARMTPMGFFSDELINPLKYCWLAFLIADSAQSPRFARLAVGAILLLGVVYALFVIKIVPIHALTDGSDFMRYRRRIDKQVGLNANDMAKVLSITFWGIVVSYRLWSGNKTRIVQACAAGFVMLGMLMCLSRAGYVTFVGAGLVVACLRFRKLLLLGPVGLVTVAVIFPSVVERSVMGIYARQEDGSYDWNEITAGRTTNLWPPIIDEIGRSPIIGHGRKAILRTAAYDRIKELEGACPNTPHNGYLEVLIDAGVIGMVAVLCMFGMALVLGAKLMFLRDPLPQAVGGLGVVSSCGCLLNAASGGILFPDQGMLGALAAMMLVIRFSPFLTRSRQRLPVRPVPTAQAVGQRMS